MLTSAVNNFLIALEGVYKIPKPNTLIVRACDEVVSAFLEVIPHDQRDEVLANWKNRKDAHLIEQG